MMEIYNERVRDLFCPKNPKNDAGLKVSYPNTPSCYLSSAYRTVMTVCVARAGARKPQDRAIRGRVGHVACAGLPTH